MEQHETFRNRVSVIIPCYNAERYIERTVVTVLAQTLTEWQLVLVDDGSTDGTAPTLDRIASKDARIRVIKQENQGVCGARNHGATVADSSDYLLFLDADDLIDPTMLATMAEHLDRHPQAVLAYCGLEMIDADDRPLPTWAARRVVPKGVGYKPLSPSMPRTPLPSLMAYFAAIPSTCVFRRTEFSRTEGWDPRFVYHGDKDMVLKMATLGEVHYVANSFVRYRQHGTTLSSTVGATPYRWTENYALTTKWWVGEQLSPPQRKEMRSAILFDYWVTMLLQTGAAASAVQRGELQAGCKLLLQAGNKGRQFLRRYVEMKLARG